MQRWKLWVALTGVLFGLPYALLLLAGFVWLYQHHWLLQFLLVSAAVMFAGWLLTKRFRQYRPLRNMPSVDGSASWSPTGQAAWKDVEALADQAQADPSALDSADDCWQLMRRVIEAVAVHFHPKSNQPSLEVTLPDALHIVELVAHDLRSALRDRVPGSHMVTIHDLQRVKRLAGVWDQLYGVFRVGHIFVNPIGAIVREARDSAMGEMTNHSLEELQRWAIAYCVKKAGFYAIQLYSGQLVIDDEKFRRYVTEQSRDQAGEAVDRKEQLEAEPLRMLVIGQVKAGKSSLINALFGEVRAATDVIPLTRGVEPYVLDRGGLPRAIILDSAGYAGPSDADDAAIDDALLKTDLVLLVCSARVAAREPDRQLLNGLRERFQRNLHRSLPPVVVVLTHIDSLRPFSEWNPPYDLLKPNSPKAEAIAAAVRAVAGELQMEVDRVVPVCLLPERRYNVEDGLIPAMVAAMPSAERAKLLRAVQQYHDDEYWQLLWQQAANTGRLLVGAGTAWAGRKAEQLGRKLAGRD